MKLRTNVPGDAATGPLPALESGGFYGSARIAERAGVHPVHPVHPVHFAVVFRRFHGCSLGEYARRRRLTAARAKLADRQLSLSQVAYESGFADQSHLSRTFKRYTGMTPRQYRTFLAFKKR